MPNNHNRQDEVACPALAQAAVLCSVFGTCRPPGATRLQFPGTLSWWCSPCGTRHGLIK